MQIIQEPRTIIKADEGKVFRRKASGRIVGDTVHLGYDYYDVGIRLKQPYLSTPEDYEEVDLIVEVDEEGNEITTLPPNDTFKRLNRMVELIEEERKQIQNYSLTPPEMLAVKSLYPRWGIDLKVGDFVKEGVKFQYDNKLYEVLQEHTIMQYYYPNDNTKHLYKQITANELDI